MNHFCYNKLRVKISFYLGSYTECTCSLQKRRLPKLRLQNAAGSVDESLHSCLECVSSKQVYWREVAAPPLLFQVTVTATCVCFLRCECFGAWPSCLSLFSYTYFQLAKLIS